MKDRRFHHRQSIRIVSSRGGHGLALGLGTIQAVYPDGFFLVRDSRHRTAVVIGTSLRPAEVEVSEPKKQPTQAEIFNNITKIFNQ